MRLFALAVSLVLGCGRLGFDTVGDDIADPAAPDGGARDDIDGGPAVGGPDAKPPENCADAACRRLVVDQATFLRDDNAWYPATTSRFELDRYEVTVARFREFVAAGFGTRATAPAGGAGAHPAIAGSGWQTSWAALLATSTSDLVDRLESAPSATYSPSPSSDDELPIVGVTWYEAFAFCVWDGARLPTVAEHEAAAFGGDEQRLYPWGADYDASNVAIGALDRIARHSPAGDARWGHADLVGNADEWALDFFGALPQPCIDCANLTPQSTPTRVLLGGSFLSNTSDFAQTALLHGAGPGQRTGTVGFRCAR
ncbi:MAG: formylglycine-generating enzyme family protein [Kofleriaceae bacterium]